MTCKQQSMRSRSVFGSLVLVLGLVGGLALSGCGDGLSGNKYETTGVAAGAMSVEFKSGGKVAITMLGMTKEADYTKDGDKVTLKNPGGIAAAGDLVFTVNKDGSLTGPEGVVLAKKKS
jgi:hypothetical protein